MKLIVKDRRIEQREVKRFLYRNHKQVKNGFSPRMQFAESTKSAILTSYTFVMNKEIDEFAQSMPRISTVVMKYEKDLVSRGICWSCNHSQCLTSSLQICWTIISTVSQIKRSRQSRVYMVIHLFVAIFARTEEHGVAATRSKVDQIGHCLSVQCAQDRFDGWKVPLSARFLENCKRFHSLRLLKFGKEFIKAYSDEIQSAADSIMYKIPWENRKVSIFPFVSNV